MQFAEGMKEAMRINDELGEAGAAFWAEGIETVPTEDGVYEGAAGQRQALRRYHGGGAGPVVFYIHGGGWVGGSIAMNERACQHLARAGFDVVSVSYRLAPEYPYPAGLEDCRAALRDLRLENEGRPVVLAGASAGANLAMALAFDEPCDGLLLFYGVFGDDTATESHRAYGEGFGLSSARVTEIFALYDPDGARVTDPRVCPLAATDDALAALPRTLLLVAEMDVLRDDSIALARRLAKLGVDHDLLVEPGVTHGFINRGRLVPAADACLDRAARFLSTLKEEIAA